MPEFKKSFKEFLREKYEGPYGATDIIIRYNDGKKDGVVLIQRKNYPLGLAFPGGLGEYIPFAQNALKESEEETGLKVVLDDSLRPFLVLSGVNDDPRAFISTCVYTGKGSGILRPHPDEDAWGALVATHDELYNFTKKKELWSMERHRNIGLLYLDHVGYAPAKKDAEHVRQMIIAEYVGKYH